MGFFKDMKGTITGTINGTIPNGGENLLEKTSELAKYNKQISDSRKRMMILYQNIGMKYYSEKPELKDPQFREWFGHLDREIALITAAEERIRTLKGLVMCPACGAEIQADAAFCTSCGNRMPVKETAGQRTCPVCGMTAAEEAIFCTNCGCNLQEASAAEPTTAAAGGCAHCGALLRENAAFCTNCGKRVDEMNTEAEGKKDPQALYDEVDQPVQFAESLWNCSSEQTSDLVLDGIEREEKKTELKDYMPELVLDSSAAGEEMPEKVTLKLDEI